MKAQTQYGYRLLQEGGSEGMIFLEHGVCDIGLDTVEWTRAWLDEVGEKRLAR